MFLITMAAPFQTGLTRLPICLAPVMFASLLPRVLQYRRGALARIGELLSVAMIILVFIAATIPATELWYPHILAHMLPALTAIFYVFATAGLAVCAVGIFDRKRSAIVMMLAVFAMMWSWEFLTFWILLAIALVLRKSDGSVKSDLRESPHIAANNRTRRSRSIPRKLIREGRFELIPVLYLLNLSGLAHEGISNSGSYDFADHIYRSIPSGKTWVGRWIDSVLLAMPATKAFRLRYKKSQQAIQHALTSVGKGIHPLRVLAIPCGLPRDLTELATTLSRDDPQLLGRMEYVGMDVDPALLEKARQFTLGCGVPSMQFHQGNALLRDNYPPGQFHVAVSTGLGEFLDDGQLALFYSNIFDVIAAGGTFYTSISHSEPRSERLLNAFELNAHYRLPVVIEKLLRQRPWTQLTITQDPTGLQSFVVAVK